jgi:hypothetical protein
MIGTNYLFISLFEHANAIEVKLESGNVRENRVRKPYRWDSIKLGTCGIVEWWCK